jgi:hypothetical protein
MDISIVIPVYGCREAVPELYKRLVATLEDQGKTFDIIMVDDHCPQNSWEEIEKLCEMDNRVVGIRLSRNFGQMRAITAGLEKSVGDLVAVMKGILHAKSGQGGNLHPADPGKAVGHLLPLGPQRGGIGHMESAAAAAPGIVGAARIPALRGKRRQQLLDPAEGIALFYLNNMDQGLLAGKQPGHEHRQSLMAADALHVRSQPKRGHPDPIIFLHLRRSFKNQDVVELFYQSPAGLSTS